MIESRHFLWPQLALLAALAWPSGLAAQFSEPPTPAAYALQGVTVVRADGSRLAGVNLVIRKGRIAELGPNAAIPADAKLLEGDSLYVYPGFIDAAGKADYEFPETKLERSEVASWNPPREAQSFMPHRRVADHLRATGPNVADQRKQGIVAAAVHPDGRLMPGRAALLVFRKDAETPEDLVARPALGPLMSFQGAPGVYPATLFAVIAFYRQMFENAKHHAAQVRAHSANPAAAPPPAWDPDLEVVGELMDGRTPVFFAADRGRDIQRVLKLAAEYGFRPIIVGGEEAWKVADDLKAANVPVLVSLDFPKPERWKPEKKKEEEPEAAEPGDGDQEQDETAAQDEELDAGALREKQRIEEIYANAGRLAAAGVPFALTSGGGKADLREGARKAIEYGLSEPEALKALSATPASLLGLAPMVRIDRGRPANLIVSDGPLFAEETEIRYTFVEGALEKGEDKKAAGEAPAVVVTGTWEVSIETPEESFAVTMTLKQEGSSFSGTMVTPFGEATVKEGVVSGNTVTFTVVVGTGDESLTVELEGKVEGDEASGTGEAPDGSFTWTAKRTSGPEEEPSR